MRALSISAWKASNTGDHHADVSLDESTEQYSQSIVADSEGHEASESTDSVIVAFGIQQVKLDQVGLL